MSLQIASIIPCFLSGLEDFYKKIEGLAKILHFVYSHGGLILRVCYHWLFCVKTWAWYNNNHQGYR